MKKVIAALLVVLMVLSFTGCDTEANRVSQNLSQQADNFNVVRRITVINCIQNEVLFQMTGRMSLDVDTKEHKIDVIVEKEDGTYQKHFIGLSDNVTYVIEDLGSNNVSKYHYTLNYNPKMWLPFDAKNVD